MSKRTLYTMYCILAFCIIAGFAVEESPERWRWALTLSIWLVRAVVVIAGPAIAQRVGKVYAIAATVTVALCSGAYVWALYSMEAITQEVMIGLFVLNLFLILYELYVGILQGEHPDTVALRTLADELAKEREEVLTLGDRIAKETELVRKHAAHIAELQKQAAMDAKSFADERQQVAKEIAEYKADAAVYRKIKGLGAQGAKLNGGRYVCIEFDKLSPSHPFEAVTLGDNEDQLRKRTGFPNGQLKLTNTK